MEVCEWRTLEERKWRPKHPKLKGPTGEMSSPGLRNCENGDCIVCSRARYKVYTGGADQLRQSHVLLAHTRATPHFTKHFSLSLSIPLYPSLYLSLHLSLYPSLYPSLSFSILLSLSLSIFLHPSLSFSIPLYPSPCLSIFLSIPLYMRL